jgi:hypothetical protein
VGVDAGHPEPRPGFAHDRVAGLPHERAEIAGLAVMDDRRHHLGRQRGPDQLTADARDRAGQPPGRGDPRRGRRIPSGDARRHHRRQRHVGERAGPGRLDQRARAVVHRRGVDRGAGARGGDVGDQRPGASGAQRIGPRRLPRHGLGGHRRGAQPDQVPAVGPDRQQRLRAAGAPGRVDHPAGRGAQRGQRGRVARQLEQPAVRRDHLGDRGLVAGRRRRRGGGERGQVARDARLDPRADRRDRFDRERLARCRWQARREQRGQRVEPRVGPRQHRPVAGRAHERAASASSSPSASTLAAISAAASTWLPGRASHAACVAPAMRPANAAFALAARACHGCPAVEPAVRHAVQSP